MAHGSKYRQSSSTCGVNHLTRASSVVALPDNNAFPIGFYSLKEHDPEEAVLRAELEKAGDFTWQRLQFSSGVQGDALPAASEVAALRPGAVIVVLSTSERAVIEPLF